MLTDTDGSKIQPSNGLRITGNIAMSRELKLLIDKPHLSRAELESSNDQLGALNEELSRLNAQLQAALHDKEISHKKLEVQTLMTQNLLMTAPGFVCILKGPKHVYEMVNERYQQLFGMREIQGKPMLEALPELAGQGFDTLLDNVYATGETYVGIEIPITFSRDEGLEPESRHFNFSYQPMFSADKTIYAILVFGYDVTEAVNAKDKIMEAEQARSKELEERVDERTRELKNAVEKLDQMNKELVSFAYVSSHDLQEPLRKIQTFSSKILLTEYDVLSDNGKDLFQRINVSASRMRTLINDLLTYSETNVEERQFMHTDLTALVQEVIAENADDIQERGAVIEATDLASVRINPFQFRQILNNLLSNSLKFSRAGVPPHIKMTCTTLSGTELLQGRPELSTLDRSKRYSHFTFSDNGVGFEPQYNERVFEIFQRLHDKNDYKGTGIGLAIVKKVVEHHYGAITASGMPGAGFDIYLPAD